MKKNYNYIYIILVIIILSSAGYFGYKYLHKTSGQNDQVSTEAPLDTRGQSGFGSRSGDNRSRGDFKSLHGTISSVEGKTIIIKADDGTAKTIKVTDTTRIIGQENGQRTTLEIADLKQNDEISVMASNTTGATIDARMIFIGAMPIPSQRPDSREDNSTSQNSPDGPSGLSVN